jgi:FMN phosphatase YigB (HAD superfamily)
MKTILVDAVECFIVEKDKKFEVFQEMFNLLEKYQNKKIVLTGADDKGIEKYGLNKIPYEFFTLKHNPEKTNPEYYKILLNDFNLKKDEVIYFEHNIDAVKSAQSVGINTYYYDNNKKDLESLQKFLDENLK